MPLSKNYIIAITGRDDTFSLEHRIFNISSFFITTFSLLGGVANFLIGLHPVTVWLSGLGFIISASLYYVARIRCYFSASMVIIYVLATIGILSGMHFYNGGLAGNLLYLLVIFLHIFLLIVPIKYQYWVYLLMYLNILGLILLEYFYPEWVLPYTSKEEQVIDYSITLLYALFFSTSVILTFRLSYNKERQKVVEQNNELVSLNEQISLQREILELKTMELEEAVMMAHDRHAYINTLLRELNHRVKNNLQVISSLLNLQAFSIEDENARKAILEGKNRLVSMILIHQRLYHNQNATQVFMVDYLKELTETIMHTYNGFLDEDTVEYAIEPVWLDVESAIPLGLICNELISNAFKHAYKDTPDPYLFVKLESYETFYLLEIADNGCGMKKASAGKTFGMDLVSSLVKQLNGNLSVEADRGTKFMIRFSKSRKAILV